MIRPSTIKPSRVKPGCYALLVFVAIQPFMYGQARDVVRRAYLHLCSAPPTPAPPHPRRCLRPHLCPCPHATTLPTSGGTAAPCAAHTPLPQPPARAVTGARPRTPTAAVQDFMCRSITLAGGLLLLIWSENDKQRRRGYILDRIIRTKVWWRSVGIARTMRQDHS